MGTINARSKRMSEVSMPKEAERAAEPRGAAGWQTYKKLIHKATIGYSGYRPGVYSQNVFSRNYKYAARQGIIDLDQRRAGLEPDVPPNTAVTRKPETRVEGHGLDNHFAKIISSANGFTGHQPGVYSRSYVACTKRQASAHDWFRVHGDRENVSRKGTSTPRLESCLNSEQQRHLYPPKNNVQA